MRSRRRGDADLGVSGGRLGQQADRGQRRPELVREIVDELGADPLQPAQLGDVLENEPHARDWRTPGANGHGGTGAGANRQLADGRPALHRRPGDALDPDVDERLQRGVAHHRAGPSFEDRVSRTVGELHGQIVAKADHAGGQQLGQVAAVVAGLVGIPASVLGLLEGHPDASLDIVGIDGAGDFLEPLDGTSPRYRDGQRPAEEDREGDDEDQRDRFHESSMAHAVDFGLASWPNWRARPADATLSVCQGRATSTDAPTAGGRLFTPSRRPGGWPRALVSTDPA